MTVCVQSQHDQRGPYAVVHKHTLWGFSPPYQLVLSLLYFTKNMWNKDLLYSVHLSSALAVVTLDRNRLCGQMYDPEITKEKV